MKIYLADFVNSRPIPNAELIKCMRKEKVSKILVSYYRCFTYTTGKAEKFLKVNAN